MERTGSTTRCTERGARAGPGAGRQRGGDRGRGRRGTLARRSRVLPPPAGTLGPSSSTPCGTIHSNASLDLAYLGFYDSLRNESTGWGGSGPNVTAALNQSGYPPVGTAEGQLQTAWLSICESSRYGALYAALGAQGITSGSFLNGTNGHYEFDYGFTYVASYSAPSHPGGSGCSVQAQWNVDLVNGAVSGPWISASSASLGGGPIDAPNRPSAPADPASPGVVLAAAAGIGTLAALLAFAGRRR